MTLLEVLICKLLTVYRLAPGTLHSNESATTWTLLSLVGVVVWRHSDKSM